MKNLDKPLVSIICPTYNHENYIRQCLEGFINQILDFDIEIIVHDDASTDKTVEIIKEFESKYPDLFNNIYQIENQFSKDVASVSRIMYDKANGKYFAFCEGDDYWKDPYKLKKQVELLESTNSDFCYSDFDIFFNEENIFKYDIFKNRLSEINKDKPLLTYGSLGVPSWVFKSDFLKDFDLNSYNISDKSVLILIEFLRTNGKICFLSESTTVYRKNLN